MSLDLDKSGSYIRSITSGMAMPSVRELFNIIRYFEITPAEFFSPLERDDTACATLCNRIRMLNEDEMKKVNIFLDIIK
jgi:transcriptional regulator with XRE-family HTH domain